MEEEEKTAEITSNGDKKKPLMIDYEELFGPNHDEPVPEIVVVPAGTDASDRRRRPPEKKKKPKNSSSGSVEGGNELSLMSDHDLQVCIDRRIRTIATVGRTLFDKGAKLKDSLRSLQEEQERRKLRRSQQDAGEFKKSVNSGISNCNGALDGPKQADLSSQFSEESSFATYFMKKMQDDEKLEREQNTGDRASNKLDCEISCLNRCDKQKRKSPGQLPPSKRTKPSLFSKNFSAWEPSTRMPPKGNRGGRASSTGDLPLPKDELGGSSTEKDASQGLNSDGLKNEKTVVLVDEEEAELVVRKQEDEELPSSTRESKIYYPSREDPESLEIFRSELKCLEPGECLTSTIMNFYIRFLQEVGSPDRLQHDFHFFNTYFYSKLQEAVACQKSDKEAFFGKFRRWWRGINIFQKAYIFLPINEDKHWSLVIICIPDKEEESGPVILHLDSLGLHSSRLIFDNIKSLLKNEWEYLNEDVAALDFPIPDRIWKYLPRRIDEKIITVPRQTNDYDCGLFVLYYMERFIQDAPCRLKRQHLSMFGKNWFKPREASSLRGKIKKILQEQFYEAPRDDNCIWKPVCLSSNSNTKTMDEEIEAS